MEISIAMPLDSDGFLRRECPRCVREFKWFPDEDDDAEVPEHYYCPLCGGQAPVGEWWTPEQLAFAQASALRYVSVELGDELAGLGTSKPGGLISLDVTMDTPPAAVPPLEPDDMVIVEPPCHPDEPVKIPEDSGEVLYCLLCGSPYTA